VVDLIRGIIASAADSPNMSVVGMCTMSDGTLSAESSLALQALSLGELLALNFQSASFPT
jgi:hypothetical protein